MSMLFCFDDSPIPNDIRNNRDGSFQISMMDTLTHNQPICLFSYMMPCCFAFHTRYEILQGDMTRYSCCQGYMDNACFRAGQFGEQSTSWSPYVCLALESSICLGPSVSSSRMHVSDLYNLRPDPFDNQIIRFTNCVVALGCVFDVLSLLSKKPRGMRKLKQYLHYFTKIVVYSTIGCMNSQVNYELQYRRDAGKYGSFCPCGSAAEASTNYGSSQVPVAVAIPIHSQGMHKKSFNI
jgi:hypothetical protein